MPADQSQPQQPPITATTTVTAVTTFASTPTYDSPPSQPKWGDLLESIPPTRQGELRVLYDQQVAWAEQEQSALYGPRGAWDELDQSVLHHSPFAQATGDADHRSLTGAEVFFLSAYVLAGPDGDLEASATRLRAAKQEPAIWGNLKSLHLEGANLSLAHLEGANFFTAHLEGADLSQAHLEGANLSFALLWRANFWLASLDGAYVSGASLEGAYLFRAHLAGANISLAHLEGASLEATHLEGADLHEAHLEGTNLSYAFMDSKTVLFGAVLSRQTLLGDIQWGGVGSVNLTQLNWRDVPTLGDEVGVTRTSIVEQYEAVVRTYRQLAAQLRAHGMSEVADRFAYRAQVWQRKTYWRQKRLLALFGSLLLDGLAGYGFRPGRSLLIYLVVILGFAALFFTLGPTESVPFSPVGAVVFSLTSFHGRGFFPGGSPGHSLTLDDPVTVIAALEAVFGLLIEISFIATFTQRFFGAK
jgi:uncharacterized protein YjbI with pentapeptide repeats